MTVRDLYIYTNDEQTFIIFKHDDTKPYFKGSLKNGTCELMYQQVHKFRAIDFNTIEVILLR